MGSGTTELTTVPAARSPTTLLRVVGQQANRANSDLGEHRRRLGVVARIHREAECDVGVDGVGATVLSDVGAKFVDQTDPAPFVVGGIHQHAASLGGDHAESGSKLHSAVAPQRPERVAGEAFGVEAHQYVLAVDDVAHDHRHVHMAGRSFECVDVEQPVRGLQRYSNGSLRRRPTGRS